MTLKVKLNLPKELVRQQQELGSGPREGPETCSYITNENSSVVFFSLFPLFFSDFNTGADSKQYTLDDIDLVPELRKSLEKGRFSLLLLFVDVTAYAMCCCCVVLLLFFNVFVHLGW